MFLESYLRSSLTIRVVKGKSSEISLKCLVLLINWKTNLKVPVQGKDWLQFAFNFVNVVVNGLYELRL